METDNVTAVTFIVRLVKDRSSGVTGTVERVRTGFKERFHGYADLG